MKIRKTNNTITSSTKKKFTVKASENSRRDRFINPDEFVFYYNGKKLYQGDGTGFKSVITNLCKDESVNAKFQKWCNQFGDPFDFDGTPEDTAYVFCWLVDQERMEREEGFYSDGDGIINFELFPANDEVNASTKTSKFTVKASKNSMSYRDEWINTLSKENSNKTAMVYKDGEFYAEYSMNIAMEVAEEIGGEVVDSDTGEVIKVYGSTSKAKKFTVKTSTEASEIMKREEFVDKLIEELEQSYDIKLSEEAYGTIHDLAKDLDYGKGAEKHGSTPTAVLENAIYDIFEKDTGVVIGGATEITSAEDSDINPAIETITNQNSIAASSDGPLQVCEHCLWGIESREGKQVVYDTLEYDSWDEDAEPLICDWCEEESDILYQITPGGINAATYYTYTTNVDADDIKTLLRNDGINPMGVRVAHLPKGKAFAILLPDNMDASVIMNTIIDAGYTVEYDSVVGDELFIYVEGNSTDPKFLYRVSYGYSSDIVEMDDETSDYQAILDTLIDNMESTGETGYLMNLDEAEAEYNEDEYVIGGNHGLALIHNGNFSVDPIGWSNEVDEDIM